jgi:D-glutamate cyclase
MKPEALPAFESLDRLATVEMRPPTSPSGILGGFYALARQDRERPLTHDIAAALLERRGQPVLIVTGLVDSVRFPHGEVDGPIGSLALARTLAMLGSEVTIVIDAEAMEPVARIAAHADLENVTLREADFGNAAAAGAFAEKFGIVIAVEKLGRNAVGGRHLVWGTPVDVGDPHADEYFRAAQAAGALTVAVGDNGNEIGFGAIRNAAEPLTPAGVEVEGGFFAATAVDHFIPASVSNLGCYAIAAALAVLARQGDLAMSGERVREWTALGLATGLRSGGVDDPDFQGDDGIPLRYIAAHAEVMAGVVHQSLLGDPWNAR